MRPTFTIAILCTLAACAMTAASTFADEHRSNEPPIIIKTTLPDGLQDDAYLFNLTATDADDDVSELTWSDDTDMFDVGAEGEISFLPENDDVGYNYVNVTVEDPAGNTDTEEFLLFIANVNDPPTLKYIPPQVAQEDELFVLELSEYVEDPDLELPMEFRDRITYRDDTTRIDTNLETGKVTWTPTNDDFGEHFFMVTVQDTKGRYASQEIKITVNNVNDPPEIGIIGKQILVQGRLYSFNVPYEDQDEDVETYDEIISFSNDNTELFVIDAVTGRIQFTPENQHVGFWEVTITVTDAAGATDSDTVVFEVQNENDRPTIEYVPYQQAFKGELFQLQIVAEDPDLAPRLVDGTPVDPDERLEYRTNSSRVAIDRYSGLISFTPNDDDVRMKVLDVRLTVVDRSSETCTVDIRIVVTDRNTPPSDLRMFGIENDQVVRTDEKYPLSASANDDSDGPADLDYRWLLDGEVLSQVQSFEWTPEGEGPKELSLEVTDTEGASSLHVISILILYIPMLPEILTPTPNAVIDEDQEVRFELDFPEEALDPERDYTVTVSSNVSGLMYTGDASETMEFDTTKLPLGPHTLTIVLSDGTNEASTTLNVTVKRAEKKTDSPGVGVVISIISIAVVAMGVALRRRRG